MFSKIPEAQYGNAQAGSNDQKDPCSFLHLHDDYSAEDQLKIDKTPRCFCDCVGGYSRMFQMICPPGVCISIFRLELF